MRAGFGGVYAVDYGAVLATAEALGADRRLVAELLPRVEGLIVGSYRREDDDDD